MPVAVMIEPGQRDLLDEIEAIYRTKLSEFRRVARAVLDDADAAHDAVQDGFVRAVRDRTTFRGTASLEGWVWGCVMNAIREAARTLVKHRRPIDLRLLDIDSVHERQDDVIRTALRHLPERQRLALFLRHYADLDYAEIGDALGIRTGTVSATLHAARAALRDALEGDEP
jgi:RNA polymerase sigma factor (sigma-70 family)